MKTKSHNFNLRVIPRDKHKKNTELITIYLEYRSGSKRSKLSTGVKVPKGAWSMSKSKILLKEYPYLVESQERLDEIMSKTYSQVQLLNKKKTSVETALDEVLQRMPDESILEYYDEWYKKTKGVEYSTYKQRRGMIISIQNKMTKIGRKEYSVLKFEHFADNTSLEKIATLIKKDMDLEPNGSYGYLKKLDEIYNKKYKGASPFGSSGLRGKYEDPRKEGVEFRDLLSGIGSIKTIQDLESYLFFLYSLCLRGLNGKDIFTMRDEDFVGVDANHFIPNSSLYYEKQHYLKRRGKTKNKMKILSNLFPTLQIRNWLQWCVEIERPTLCKKDNEGYAIFREFSKEEVYKHWSMNLRTTYSENLKALIGKGINSARHTYTENGQDIDIPTAKLESSMGHTPRELRGKSIRNYMKDKEEELDLIHIDILDECEIVELYFQLWFFLKDKKPFRGKAKRFFPDWFEKEHNYFGYMYGERLGLIGWTYKDEFRLQKLEKRQSDLEYLESIKSGRIKVTPQQGGGLLYEGTVGETGNIKVPKELQELRDKKDRIEKEKRDKELKEVAHIRDKDETTEPLLIMRNPEDQI